MGYRSSNHLITQSQQKFFRQDIIPFYVKRAKGAYLYDYDQNKFIDFFLNNGSLILGHAHPQVTRLIKNSVSKGWQYSLSTNLELRLAEQILSCYPAIETIRFYDSKTIMMNKIRQLLVKRTGKAKLLLIGSYEKDNNNDILVSDYDLDKIAKALSQFQQDIGAICLAPIFLQSSLQIQAKDFYHSIQEIANKYNVLLILDEEITGFRLALGGASEYFQISADLSILGNVIGGGFPLYAIGGKKAYFELYSPKRSDSYFPLYYVAGIETIKYLKRENPYPFLQKLSQSLRSAITSDKVKIHSLGSIFSIDYQTDQQTLFNLLLEKKLFLMPPFNQNHYISAVHSEHDIRKLIEFLNKLT